MVGTRSRTRGEVGSGSRRTDRGLRAFARYTYGSLLLHHCTLYVAVLLTVLVEVPVERPGSALGPLALAGYVLLTVVAVVVHVVVIRRDQGGRIPTPVPRPRPPRGLLVAFVSLPVVLVVLAPSVVPFTLVVLLPAASISFISSGRDRRIPITILATGVVVALAAPVVDVALAELLWGWFGLMLLALVYVFRDWLWGLLTELRAARDEIADMAVRAERERFAADLHDIQGHHLQAIAVQGELISRLIGEDAERARDLVDAVQARARAALEETRALVHDAHDLSLLGELRNATDLLEESGRRCVVRAAGAPRSGWSREVVAFGTSLDPETSGLLGLVVREATTNQLRHSCNQVLRIELSDDDDGWTVWMCDGSETDAVGAGARTSPTAGDELGEATRGLGAGRGLRGLGARLEQAGGSVTHEQRGSEFVVVARLPRVREVVV